MADLRSGDRSAQDRRILTMVRWLLYMAFVVIGYLVLRALSPVLAPIVAAAGVAYLLDGAVDWMERHGVKRVIAVATLLILFITVVVGVLVVIIPLASQEIARFITELPRIMEVASAWVADNIGWKLPEDWVEYLQGDEFRHMLSKAAGPLAAVTAAVVGGVFSFLGFIAEMLLVPVFAFYLLVDWDHFVARARLLIPPRYRVPVGEIMVAIDGAVSTWIRGQLIVKAILAVLYATAFRIIGIQLGVTIGVIVGLLTIIPFLGTFVGAGLTVLVVVLDWHGPQELIAVGIVFVVLHLIEAAVLTPKIVGKKVGLGELGALFAVLAGGKLLGFTGVLLAVPLAASVAVLVRRGVRYYEQTEFFAAGAELEPKPPPPAPPARALDLELGPELLSEVDAALAPDDDGDLDDDVEDDLEDDVDSELVPELAPDPVPEPDPPHPPKPAATPRKPDDD